MSTGAALLKTLAGRGVVLVAESGKLRYRAPAGTMTPDLRRQIEAHRAALLALLASGQQAGLFDTSAPSSGAAGPVIQGETGNDAGALVAGSDQGFRRLRHDVLDMAAELDQLLAELGRVPGRGLEFARPDNVAHAAWLRFCELDSQWARLAPVAEHETFEELEAATGAAYLAAVANPSDQALARTYARLDDAWAAVLALPEVQP